MIDHAPARLDFLGTEYVCDGFDATADWLIDIAASRSRRGAPRIITHVNVHNFCRLNQDPALFEALSAHGDLVLDGIGMKLGARLAGAPWPGDLNGTDLFPLVMERAAACGVRVYFLGTDAATIATAASRTREFFRELAFVGYHCGYFDESHEARVAEQINASGAELVLVGRGCPLQERFALRIRGRLDAAVLWMVGGLFDFVGGRCPRAPRWTRRMRLEWLHRVCLDPGGKWHRVVVEGPWFLSHLIWAHAAGKRPALSDRARTHWRS